MTLDGWLAKGCAGRLGNEKNQSGRPSFPMRDGENQVKNFVPMGGVDVMPLASKRGFGPRAVRDHRRIPLSTGEDVVSGSIDDGLVVRFLFPLRGLGRLPWRRVYANACDGSFGCVSPRHGTSWDVPSLPAGERGYSINVQFSTV